MDDLFSFDFICNIALKTVTDEKGHFPQNAKLIFLVNDILLRSTNEKSYYGPHMKLLRSTNEKLRSTNEKSYYGPQMKNAEDIIYKMQNLIS